MLGRAPPVAGPGSGVIAAGLAARYAGAVDSLGAVCCGAMAGHDGVREVWLVKHTAIAVKTSLVSASTQLPDAAPVFPPCKFHDYYQNDNEHKNTGMIEHKF